MKNIFLSYFFYIILFFSFYIFLHCNNTFFYQPTKEVYFHPDKLLLKYKELYLEGVDHNKLHAWLFPISSSKSLASPLATIVQFHGNGENISSHYLSLLWLRKYKFEIFIFDYRGYGRSEGQPDTGKIIADSKLVLEFIQKKNKPSKRPIIVYGQSLGGVIAARTLGEMKDKALIKTIVIESSFSSYRSIAKQIGSKICLPIGYLAYPIISDAYAIQDFLPKFKPIHTIVIHGNKDTVVPYRNGLEIFNLASQPKDFLKIQDGGHLNWHLAKRYRAYHKILAEMLINTLIEP